MQCIPRGNYVMMQLRRQSQITDLKYTLKWWGANLEFPSPELCADLVAHCGISSADFHWVVRPLHESPGCSEPVLQWQIAQQIRVRRFPKKKGRLLVDEFAHLRPLIIILTPLQGEIFFHFLLPRGNLKEEEEEKNTLVEAVNILCWIWILHKRWKFPSNSSFHFCLAFNMLALSSH